MILRSGKRIGNDNIPINFNEASKLWRKKIKYQSNMVNLDIKLNVKFC
jgi:hypothetical protein